MDFLLKKNIVIKLNTHIVCECVCVLSVRENNVDLKNKREKFSWILKREVQI